MRDTNPDFAASQQSTTQIQVPATSKRMAELDYVAYGFFISTTLPICSVEIS